MPAPITHIVLALAVLPLLQNKDQGAFIRGTSFPDIRYCLKNLSRDATHFTEVNWADVQQEPSSFKAGVLFHSLVDRLNNPFLDREYEQLVVPDPRFKGYFLKIFQDIILYDTVNDWPSIVKLFDVVDAEIGDYQVSSGEALSWHQKLKTYCCHKPTMETVIGIIGDGVIAQKARAVGDRALQAILANEDLKKPILNFHSQFLQMLK